MPRARAAWTQLTRTLAAEWAKYNINVNALAPALVMTDMTREFLSKPEIYSKMTAEIPLARLGVPEDIIGPVILLGLGRVRLHDRADHLCRRRTVRRVIDAERK